MCLPAQGWPAERRHRAWPVCHLPTAQYGGTCGYGSGAGRRYGKYEHLSLAHRDRAHHDGYAKAASRLGGVSMSPATMGPATPDEIRTTGACCGVGCGMLAKPDGAGGITVRGDSHHPANLGRLCSKEVALGETLSLDDRLPAPSVHGTDTDCNSALGLLADRLSATVAEHGPDAAAFYVSGQLLTEDYCVARTLMKGFIGPPNIDTNSRPCMASIRCRARFKIWNWPIWWCWWCWWCCWAVIWHGVTLCFISAWPLPRRRARRCALWWLTPGAPQPAIWRICTSRLSRAAMLHCSITF